METKDTAATTEELVLMNLPSNDLAYTNRAYVHHTCSLLKTLESYVKIGYRYVFQLEAHDNVAPGTIALSSLQREPIMPPVKLGETTTVSSFDPKDAPPAVGVTIVYEPVANFKVRVALHLLQRFLAKTFEGHVVTAGQCLASNQFEKRVFKFELKGVRSLGDDSEYARITPKTIFTCECHPRAKDVVEQIPASPRRPDLKTKDPVVPLVDLAALITAYRQVWAMKPDGVDVEKTKPYDQVLDILTLRIETIWEQEVGPQKRSRVEYVPGTVQPSS